MKTKHESCEIGIDTGCAQYQIDSSIILNLIGNSKVGPCLILKANGQKKGLYIAKEDAYELMSIVVEDTNPLAKVIEWSKGKSGSSLNKFINKIESYLVDSSQHEKCLSVQI